MKLAAWLTVAGIIITAVGVALFDFRAGLITLGALTAAVGVWNLIQE